MTNPMLMIWAALTVALACTSGLLFATSHLDAGVVVLGPTLVLLAWTMHEHDRWAKREAEKLKDRG